MMHKTLLYICQDGKTLQPYYELFRKDLRMDIPCLKQL
jgi:hypothetical protein